MTPETTGITGLTLGSIIGILGATFAVVQYLKSRDKTKGEEAREMTELKVRLDLYKEELDSLKNQVTNLDTKLMQKVEDLSKKMDEIIFKLMEK